MWVGSRGQYGGPDSTTRTKGLRWVGWGHIAVLPVCVCALNLEGRHVQQRVGKRGGCPEISNAFDFDSPGLTILRMCPLQRAQRRAELASEKEIVWRARARVMRLAHVGVMDLVTAYLDMIDRLVAVARQQPKDMLDQVRARMASNGRGRSGGWGAEAVGLCCSIVHVQVQRDPSRVAAQAGLNGGPPVAQDDGRGKGRSR